MGTMTSTGPAGPGRTPGPPRLDGVADELRDLWRTRPPRLPREGKIAGVAAGIGRRYDVDPLLVRVAFVVAALFGGAGLWVYLAGWLLLDVPPGQRRRGRDRDRNRDRRGGMRPGHIVAAVVLGVVALSTLPIGDGRGGAGVVGAAALLGGLYLLYRRRPVPPAPDGYAAEGYGSGGSGPGGFGPGTPAAGTPAAGTADFADGAASGPAPADPAAGPSAPADPPVPTPPEWDPLGAAPFAWDLPTPAPEPAPAPSPRSRLTPVTLGIALIAVAAGTAAALAGVSWLTPGRVGALGLAVVGVGLLVGALRRTGHGLLVVAAPLAAFVVLASVAHTLDLDGDVGERTYRPVTVAQLQDEYSTGVGEVHLALTGLDLTESRRITVTSTVGRVEVTVPQGMAVDARCDSTVGSTDCPPPSPPGPGPVLTLDAHSTLGEVVVTRE